MTEEEAIYELSVNVDYKTSAIKEACQIAIKALEQQPCEDCISRQAVNDGFKKYDSGSFAYGCVWDYINKLPSVTPKEKTGMWINDWEMGMSECSCCGETYLWEDHKGTENFHYCPNCGARMVSE